MTNSTHARVRLPHTVSDPAGLVDHMQADHQHALEMLDHLYQLAAHIAIQGHARFKEAEARQLIAFFRHQVREHQMDEEIHMYPPLLRLDNPGLAQQARELVAEHAWIEEIWRGLEPVLMAVAHGDLQGNGQELFYAVEVFVQLFKNHMRLEERMVYPVALHVSSAVPIKPSVGSKRLQPSYPAQHMAWQGSATPLAA